MTTAESRKKRPANSQVKQPRAKRAAEAQMCELFRRGHDLYPQVGEDNEGMHSAMMAKNVGMEETSHQGVATGRKAHPFALNRAAEFKAMNPHHSACIDAKKVSMVGLGHEKETIADKLDPLCAISWQHTLLQLGEDLENTGNAYLEVIRENPEQANSKIVGLHWMPSRDVWIHIENARYQIHFEVFDRGSRTSTGGVDRRFSKFGDLTGPKGFFDRHPNVAKDVTSELIHFMEPSSLSRFYGVPNWLAAIAYVELAQSMVQHQFDFHQNRGVPEFMLFILGARLKKEDWKKITDSMKAQIGAGNTQKSIALNIANPDIIIQLEKLAMDAAVDGEFFQNMIQALSMSIVSAHRVPPSLAQILIPGRMGAMNEASSAIVAFQGLVIGPKQAIFESALGCTLGNDAFNGGLGLGKKDFAFQTVVDEIAEAMQKLAPLSTMQGMRQELPDAAGEGRDLNQGLKKAIMKGEWSPEVAKGFMSWLATEAS